MSKRQAGPLILALATLSLLYATTASWAQGVGSVSGTIRNGESGELLDYANVVVVRAADGAQWGTMSLGGGRFFLRDLPAGDYTITILYLGYKKVSEQLSVAAGQATQRTFDLEVTVVKTFDEFVVEGQAVMVEVKETEFKQTVRSEDLTDYAVDSVEEAVAQQAGIVARGGELFVRGGRSGEISFRIDGIQVDDPLGGGAMGVGNLGVASVETVTGGQDPEYGNALSGVVNITTREGGDTFEAQMRFFTDDFGRQDRTYTNYDRLEFAFGGPTPIPRFTYFFNGDLSFADNENFNRAFREENEFQVFGQTVFKYRARQTNSSRAAVKLAYGFDPANTKKLTFELTGNWSQNEQFLPNWDVQGFARQSLQIPEVESVGGGAFEYTGRIRRVFYGPWVENMHQMATPRRVQYEQGNATNYETVPVMVLRDSRGVEFLGAVRPLWRGFQYDSGTYSTVQEDSSYVAFNSANRGPVTNNWSTQAKFVWRQALTETDFYTFKLARLEFDRLNSVSDQLPYEFNHGGIRAPELFAGVRNIYGAGDDFGTDADQPYFVTSGDFPVYRDQSTVQWNSRFDMTSTRYAGHKLKSGIQIFYNDLQESILANPAISDVDRFTGEYQQGTNRNVFHTFNPEASFYIQDRWEYEGMVVSGGFRWDMFSPGSAAQILLTNDDVDRNVFKYKTQLSPRLGFAFPITDRDAFHFHYGRFVQFPDRDVLFASQDPIGNQGTLGNPNLDSQLTIGYQAGIKRQFSDFVAGQIVVYNKDIYGLIAATQVTDEQTGNTLARYINQAYANARGIELTLEKRYSNRWRFELAYTYAFADGVASSQEFGSNPEGLEFLPNQELPLAWDRRHALNFRLRVEEPRVWAASLNFNYGSGFPWTPFFRFERRQDPLLENSRRLPNEYDLAVQAERQVNIYGQEIKLFLQGFNLINQDVVAVISPGIFPTARNATNGYQSYFTETGKLGGALLYDVDGDARDDFVPLNDPRVFQQHRIFRIGVGWRF